MSNSGERCERYMEDNLLGENISRLISSCTASGRHVGPGEKLWVFTDSGVVSDHVRAGWISV